MIPSSKADFSSKAYWTAFFKANQKAHFQWYLEIDQLLPIITKEKGALEIPKSKVCIPGNGDSLLAASLAQQGYSVDALDFDSGVVLRMSEKNKFPNLSYLEKDVTKLQYDEPLYDLVLDKGTLDALYSDESEENLKKAKEYLAGTVKGIKHRGKFMIVSLLQPHILELVLNFFLSENEESCFIPRLYQVIESAQPEEESKEQTSDLTKFIKFVFSFEVYNESDFAKVRALFGNKTTFQTLLPSGQFSKPVIYHDKEALKSTIIKRQKLGLALNGIKQFKAFQQFSLKISAPSQSQAELPLYDISIFDSGDQTTLKKKTALVVVIPLGMEKDESFRTAKGRSNFAEQCGFTRVMLVKRSIGYSPQDTKQVQEDLKDMIGDLIPSDCVNSSDLPFTTVPSKDGKRELYGENQAYKVFEYMNEDQEVFRECVNLEGEIVAESRVVRKGKSKSKKQKEMWENAKHLTTQSPFLEKDKNHNIFISPYHLLNSYHRAALLSLLHFSELISQPQADLNILVVGLRGGGKLPTFFNLTISNCTVYVLQENMTQVQTAFKFFKFLPTKGLKHATGLTHLASLKEDQSIDFIIFEANCTFMEKKEEIISKFSHPDGLVLLPFDDLSTLQFKSTKVIKLDQGRALLGSNAELDLKSPSLLKSILGESVFNDLKFYQSVE